MPPKKKADAVAQPGDSQLIQEPHNLPSVHGFETGSGLSEQEMAKEIGAVAAVARAEAEIKAMVVMAKKFPRDEMKAYERIIKSCQRPGFAAGAMYAFPRGGGTIKGPSVKLARNLLRCWGNSKASIQVLSDDGEQVHVRGTCWDVETNTIFENEGKLKKLVQRKNKATGITEWTTPDERDLRELVSKNGAILVRNSILQAIPHDILEDAIREVESTLRKVATGELKQDRESTLRNMVMAFSQIGVTKDMLEKHLGHGLDAVNAEELTTLRGIYASISEGNTRREEHFEMPKPKHGESGAIDMAQVAPKENVPATGTPQQ